MGYPSNNSSFPNLKNGTEISKTDQYKLTICCAIEIVFATKIELKDKDLEREIRNVLSLILKIIPH